MSNNIVVTIPQGQLRGKIEATINGYSFISFLGVPFAKAPIGNLRFECPQPPESWTGIRDATVDGTVCSQIDLISNFFGGTEDCLFLNIFTPELPSSDRKPKDVMVWIHGGGFNSGSNKREQYGPEFLIEHDIVLVAINYRVGILGFLSLEDQSLAPQNVGLRDQVAALQWIQENIIHFGGDPNNVTIFGNSAGSASIHFLMLSPMTKGLFHKAIMQSGVAICPWALGQVNGMTICKQLKKEAANEKEALEILRSVTVEELVVAQKCIPDYFIKPYLKRMISPVVEVNSENAFLPDDPKKILTSGAFHKVPVLIGYNNEEGLVIQVAENNNKVDLCPDNLEEFIPHYFGVQLGSSTSKEIAKKIQEYYFGNIKPSKNNKLNFYKIYSSVLLVNDIYNTIHETLKNSKEKLYFYRLSLDSALNMCKIIGKVRDEGACHADDIFYIFKDSRYTPDIKPGSIEDVTIQKMTKWWTNFAKYGDPNGVGEDALLEPNWPHAELGKLQCLDIGQNISIINAPDGENVHFWKSLENMAKIVK